MRGVLAAVVGVFVLVSGALAEPPVRDDEAGWWEARLHIDDPQNPDSRAAIGFDLWLPPVGDDRPAYIRNGVEFIEADFERNQHESVVRFPHYDSVIHASLDESGKLVGTWKKMRSNEAVAMRFSANAPDPRRTEFGAIRAGWSTTNGLFESMRYEMKFEESGVALGEFLVPTRDAWEQQFGRLTYKKPTIGTILTPTGDYRYLAGDFEHFCMGDSIRLSVFDGAHAFLFKASLDWNSPSRSDLTDGHFYSGAHWHETFTARRLAEGEVFELPDPFSEVSLKPGVTRLGIPKLSEPPYAGKPTIVQVMGTWCPNCHDEAPALVDLYTKHHADGLQILSLAYEYTDDPERSARQIERFKERHGATWEFVAAGVSDKAKTAATLPALTAFKSYPTTIWINPDGTVRAIHSGFSGPATGEKHVETLAEFERLTREILDAK